MGLESPTYIDDLVTTNPTAGDQRSEGDDHIRNIKAVLKNSLPDVDQAVSTIISSTTEPALNRKGTLWLDETANLVKLRNTADTAWITLPFSMTTSNTVDIDGGAIDGTPIGGTTPAAGDFTTLDATGNSTVGGTLQVTGLLTALASLSITGNITLTGTGNITLTGTVDGRDVAADGTKLDGITAGAEPNVALASQAEAEAGTENTKTMTALRTAQAMAKVASDGYQYAVGSHTFTQPQGFTKVYYLIGGAGGGGGGMQNAPTVHAGGGGGGAIREGWLSKTAGQTVAVVVGAKGTGGAASTAGTNGADTTLDATVAVAGGGVGGGASSNGAGGAGGAASGSDTNIIRGLSGQAGGNGSAHGSPGDGLGGDSGATTGNVPALSTNAASPSVGGSGGQGNNDPGGDGADGFAILIPMK